MISEVITSEIEQNGTHEIVAYAVDDLYENKQRFLGKPVISWKGIEQKYSPNEYRVFVAVGYQGLNELRAKKCHEAKQKGYLLESCVPNKINDSKTIKIGENCFVMNDALLHPYVVLESNVFVWSGAIVGHHSLVRSNCWLTSGCQIAGGVKIGESCFIANGAVIGNKIEIGAKCFIGANALVTKSTESNGVFITKDSERYRLDTNQFMQLTKFDLR